MHERALVFAEVAGLLADVGDRRPAAVDVSLGPGMLRPVVEAAWADAVRGTVLERAAVRWQRVSDELRCLTCADDYPGEAVTRCPRCGGDGLVVEPAPEITARSS